MTNDEQLPVARRSSFVIGSSQRRQRQRQATAEVGPAALGTSFWKDAQFLGVVETFNGMGGRSATDKAQGFLNQYGFSYEVAR